MKRWALLTILLYLICLISLGLPFLLLTIDEDEPYLHHWLAVAACFVVLQAALLLVPVSIARERPVPRRSVALSATIVALPMVVLTVGFLLSVFYALFAERDTDLPGGEWVLYAFLAVSWLVWGVVFYRFYATGTAEAFVDRTTRWLLRGSILTVVVAIPSHILARHRNECCSPGITLGAIAAGLAVALLSFGPGVFFLFAKRYA